MFVIMADSSGRTEVKIRRSLQPKAAARRSSLVSKCGDSSMASFVLRP